MTESLEAIFNSARQRVLAGEQLSLEEQANLVNAIRAGRFTAAEAGNASRSKKAATAKKSAGASDDELLSDLDNLGL